VQLPNKERITLVTIDMWRPFYTVVKRVLPQAEIVIDTYHVQRMGNQAVNAVLRNVREGLDKSERRNYMRDRFLLFRRNYDLPEDKKDVIKLWGQNLPKIGIAYELKEEFLDLWKLSSRAEAERRYALWRQRIPNDLIYAFKELITAISNWHREVFNYFVFKVTNAFTESANNVIKSLQRQGRTYSFEVIRAKILYGGFITKRPAYNSRKREAKDASKGKRKRQRKRASNPNSVDSYVVRLKRLRESQDEFHQLLQPPDEWKARFEHITSAQKAPE
jgi:transposase